MPDRLLDSQRPHTVLTCRQRGSLQPSARQKRGRNRSCHGTANRQRPDTGLMCRWRNNWWLSTRRSRAQGC